MIGYKTKFLSIKLFRYYDILLRYYTSLYINPMKSRIDKYIDLYSAIQQLQSLLYSGQSSTSLLFYPDCQRIINNSYR
ncbi:hypothetical protein KL86DYS2_10406 [uncultured Dysgonomonas sp.]|uniref:Uncharacterized protein n=1 Tax=uncultured Dysgonomonas sp. TaxID=206096 RepID=A0A212J0G9_9BACT|nr:hypothetical protein KL86DYS2_10406 [uncultured Dysgonomonas sp.]